MTTTDSVHSYASAKCRIGHNANCNNSVQ